MLVLAIKTRDPPLIFARQSCSQLKLLSLSYIILVSAVRARFIHMRLCRAPWTCGVTPGRASVPT